MSTKPRAPRNRTITLDQRERDLLCGQLLRLSSPTTVAEILDRTICQDLFEALPYLPAQFVDLLVIDPPYNLDKSFNETKFKGRSQTDYMAWLESWFVLLLKTLKPNGSVYVCCDWRSSAAVQAVLEKHLIVQSRITWEREKGRGALANWKNCSEDIWFLTASKEYTFNVDAVKLKRRVIAPYRDNRGRPKDWTRSDEGDFRLTHPSNLWTDISVPFWSMPENTDHPTQKPEKLIAKLILASSNRGDVVFDPFLGTGATSVVAKKLGRHFVGVEMDRSYCCLAEKRLLLADADGAIQGYSDGVFWERNTLVRPKPSAAGRNSAASAQRKMAFDLEAHR